VLAITVPARGGQHYLADWRVGISDECQFHAAAMEVTMAQFYKWTCYGAAGLSAMFGGLEYKIISPAMFDFIATAVAIIGRSGFYDGAPVSFWNFGG
jgi:hypothetical protein